MTFWYSSLPLPFNSSLLSFLPFYGVIDPSCAWLKSSIEYKLYLVNFFESILDYEHSFVKLYQSWNTFVFSIFLSLVCSLELSIYIYFIVEHTIVGTKWIFNCECMSSEDWIKASKVWIYMSEFHLCYLALLITHTHEPLLCMTFSILVH